MVTALSSNEKISYHVLNIISVRQKDIYIYIKIIIKSRETFLIIM